MLDSLMRIDRNVRRLERWLPRQPQPLTSAPRPEGLLEFIPRVSPHLEAPHHLRPVVEALEQAEREPVRAVISTPPQHGKSTVVLHSLIWRLLRNPSQRHAYITYAAQFARDQMYQASLLAERAGLELASESLDRWRTAKGGGVVATGIGGPLTGYAVDGVLVVDDYVKNRQEAESPTHRERTWAWFTSTALTRVHPGASVVVVATRWHPDDLAGRLIKDGWEWVNLPALNEDGQPLWPERRPLEWLEAQRRQIGEYDWHALYMGQPRQRGGTLFREPTYYDALPSNGYRRARGFDLAYSARRSADYSVILSGRYVDGVLYLEDCWRAQVEAPVFARQASADNSPMYIYAHGVERGAVDLFRRDYGLPIVVRDASRAGDKFTRAQRAIAAWNEGRIRVPQSAPWLEQFLSELAAFTGVGDEHDDQVDALAALWDGISISNDWRVRGEQV
ncbi:MAG: hypothetical protein KatS3mg051_1563 [Anaerolineae bacterium]|nr:MAG: hypothetical protein KatS3mg051_1563 [Anaerolineae bacterium]